MKKLLIVPVLIAFLISVIAFGGCKKVESEDFRPLITLASICSDVLGNFGDDDDNYYIGNYLIATSFMVCSDTEVSMISVKLQGPTSFRAGIYTDADGSPGSLIVQTDQIINADAWTNPNITPTSLSAVNRYWLVVITDGSIIDTGVRDRDNIGRCKVSSKLWGEVDDEGLPADLSGQSWDDSRLEIKIYTQ
ncbi:MAG: hypothetical protein A2176_01765 [Spirochaetes bacterium RBG_13_51_14]|nr:MAG: hypothetical protein A2176_01765 [Spirochaetes bacterium RBG_13_51_14]